MADDFADPDLGITTQNFEDGSVAYFDAYGNPIGSQNSPSASTGTYSFADSIASIGKSLGKDAFNAIKGAFTNSTTGAVDWGKLIGAAGGLATGMGLFGGSDQKPKGYQGKVPDLTVARQQVANTYDPNRRAGSGGQRYFTDTQYLPTSDTAGITAAQTAAGTQATGLAALNRANPARQVTAPLTLAPLPAPGAAAPATTTSAPASSVINQLPVPKYNMGGIATLAHGKYLDGPTDGMADKLPANIDGEQEARLSHGEFVIPADVVSHLGNGNSSAGAQRLYSMMDRIRQARTGTKKQGKQINPDKYVPA
jgi:hypothetical protein